MTMRDKVGKILYNKEKLPGRWTEFYSEYLENTHVYKEKEENIITAELEVKTSDSIQTKIAIINLKNAKAPG